MSVALMYWDSYFDMLSVIFLDGSVFSVIRVKFTDGTWPVKNLAVAITYTSACLHLRYLGVFLLRRKMFICGVNRLLPSLCLGECHCVLFIVFINSFFHINFLFFNVLSIHFHIELSNAWINNSQKGSFYV